MMNRCAKAIQSSDVQYYVLSYRDNRYNLPYRDNDVISYIDISPHSNL